jgi:pantoate--beta-alanine ligase
MVQQFKTRNAFLEWRKHIPSDLSLGFVPTMGNLHAGHLTLVGQALELHHAVVVSIFVNPKQFGPNEDFNRYPRTLLQDIEKLTGVFNQFRNKRLIIFCPSDPSEIYPEDFQTSVQVNALTQVLCGKSRPTHFAGVTTVVAVLLGIVRPNVLYLGQKDFQQYRVIKKMVDDLLIPCQVTPCPIVRDHDGLALSSRNQYLSADDRKIALKLPAAIRTVAQLIEGGKLEMATLEIQKICSQDQWDYLEMLDARNLAAVSPETREIILAGALYVGKTRLIDNQLITRKNSCC